MHWQDQQEHGLKFYLTTVVTIFLFCFDERALYLLHLINVCWQQNHDFNGRRSQATLHLSFLTAPSANSIFLGCWENHQYTIREWWQRTHWHKPSQIRRRKMEKVFHTSTNSCSSNLMLVTMESRFLHCSLQFISRIILRFLLKLPTIDRSHTTAFLLATDYSPDISLYRIHLIYLSSEHLYIWTWTNYNSLALYKINSTGTQCVLNNSLYILLWVTRGIATPSTMTPLCRWARCPGAPFSSLCSCDPTRQRRRFSRQCRLAPWPHQSRSSCWGASWRNLPTLLHWPHRLLLVSHLQPIDVNPVSVAFHVFF